ncbi:hypothetical protein J437_LFUL001184 [Ladona fulva]|uniref:39S ribosomal protein L12, mitochondrial n=1 Tax=Ladona fulva TaxID=123851 RepID=A0A8K0NSR5_LADFU|nr:hypothetical protein J437_LFUL001184 [Ladona fulva]
MRLNPTLIRHLTQIGKSRINIMCNIGRYSSQALNIPKPEGESRGNSPKLERIVGEISNLTLIEVSELNVLLKKTLNLPDAPMMAAGFQVAAAALKEEDLEQEPKKVQTSFTLKLLKFDDSKKVALIKEVKNLLEGMNLVQAKKFVESAPTVVKADIPKDEAEKLQEALTKAGAVCEIQ